MKALDSISSIERAMREQQHFNSIRNMTGMLDRINTQAALSSIKIADSLWSMMKAMDYGSSIQTAISSLNFTDSFHGMKKLMDQKAPLIRALDSIKTNDTLQSMMKSMVYTTSIQKAISSLNYNSHINRMLESRNYLKTLNNISQSADMSSHMQRVGAFLTKPTILEEIILSNKSWHGLDFQQININQNEFTSSIKPLSEAEDEKSFISSFLRVHPTIQLVIIFIFLQIFLPQVNNITSNILTPYVQEIILTSDKTSKGLVKEIKNISTSSFGIDVSNYRFITGTDVRLRQRPSTNSRALDELDIGQIVEVISKKKNWIQVKVTYEDEELTGWVFTRYSSRFKK